MTAQRLPLILLDDRLSVCRLDQAYGVPAWATCGSFFSVTRTPEEVSVVCVETIVPDGVPAERGWRALRVTGEVDLSVVGVLASLATPLAEVEVSLFALSTFDTDYLLVKESQLHRAIEALTAYGHIVQGAGSKT